MKPIRAIEPDPAAVSQAEFMSFYDACVAPLFAYLFRATGGDRNLAEDVAQEVFAIALRRARDGHRDVLTISWAITVGRNRLIDQWRRAGRAERNLMRIHSWSTDSPTQDDDDGVLCERLRSLPAMQRAAVMLHYVDGFSVDEVAQRLGKSGKATESLLSRARQSLRSPGGVDR